MDTGEDLVVHQNHDQLEEGGGAADAPNYGLRYDTLANMGVYLYDGKILTY